MPKRSPPISVKEFAWKEYAFFLVFLAALAVVLVARLRLLSVPLERDEGEYAYVAQQFLRGVMPFAETHNMKMPGIYFAYAGCMALFGRDIEGIHIGLLAVNVITIFLVALLARLVISKPAGYVAGAIFATLSVSETVLGVYAHAEHFVLLFAIPGVLLLYLGCTRRKWVLTAISGLLLGLSFCILQHGAFFIIFGVLFVVAHTWKGDTPRMGRTLQSCGVFIGFAACPIVGLLLTMLLSGVFKEFWFWTFTYAHKYVAMRDLGYGAQTFRIAIVPMVLSMALPWLVASIGAVCLLKGKAVVHSRIFSAGFCLFSFAAVTPGLYFRDHYFVLLLPAVALLGGMGMDAIAAFIQKRASRFASLKSATILTVLAFWPVFIERTHLFGTSPVTLSNTLFWPNPFTESLVLARFIEANSRAADRIAVVGSEPQIYFYANRKSATSFIYTYPLMENQPYAVKQQQQMISEIESAKPRFLILVRNPLSWLPTGKSEMKLFYWFHTYSLEHYAIVACANRISRDSTTYVFGNQCQSYQPQSEYEVDVYQRVD